MTGKQPVLQLVPESPAEQAARWFSLRRRKADAAEEQQFAEWLEADSANRRAYDEVTRSWEIAALAAADQRVIAMRSEALMLRPTRSRDNTRLWGAAATAAVVLLAVTGTIATNPGLLRSVEQPGKLDHMILRTGVGQQATATLADGSKVTLNTDTALEVNYTAARRDIRLISGQALFKVAHNATRPFVVAAANREVVAVGTEFEVRLDGEKVRVALVEGRVRVQPLVGANSRMPAQPIAVLAPGEQLIANTSGEVVVNRADIQKLESWAEGRVRFDDAPLSEAVAEMNRYNHTPIIITDPSLERIRISGTFRAGQSWPFAESVAEAFSIKAESSGDAIRLRSVAKS